ncbi:MAG: Na+/H+ antiporter NhaA, partial [Muribaculum sp.]|nr:Na+/H+ antiporter NhaA [Muribaculum sp.]
VKLGWAPMPQYANWKMMASIAVLGGIGFTVSLFIANLSFDELGSHGLQLLNQAKLGIVAGSLIAGIGGFLMLHHFLPHENSPETDDVDE